MLLRLVLALVAVALLLDSASIGVSAVDHAARLEEIVAKKSAEAKHARKHVDSVLKQAKARAETKWATSADKGTIDSIRDVHEAHVNSITSSESRVAGDYSRSAMHSTLAAHGVSSALVKEINSMASSQIPRESIVKHVQTHFPNKEPHEWNDIVISAISVAGKSQSEPLDTDKASKREAMFQKNRFNLAKQSMEDRMED
jgi:hypothetical protein